MRRGVTDREIPLPLPTPRSREAAERKAGLRARSARYDRSSNRILVELSNGCVFGFPPRIIPGLERATPRQIAAVDVSAAGEGLHWDALNEDVNVPGLLWQAFGTRR